MWPFQKRQRTKDPGDDAELARIRKLRLETERLTDQLDRFADQLELALNTKNGR